MPIKQLPKLVITKERVVPIVRNILRKDSLIVTDIFNYQSMRILGETVLATSCSIELVKKIRYKHHYSQIIAVGGCTALDIARACAGNAELVCIPTILSTTCISVNRSVLEFENGTQLIKTVAPDETIVSLNSILESESTELIRWTQSGFGDLFANISASIDLQYQKNDLNTKKIQKNVPEAFEALYWVIQNFQDYDEECLRILANYLHNSSLDVIKRDNTELSSGGEHILYHKMVNMETVKGEVCPTHGQIVAIGTLITAKILSELTHTNQIFEDLKIAFQKLKIPTTFSGLSKIGIAYEDLQKTLKEIPESKSILGKYFATNGFDILGRIFAEEIHERCHQKADYFRL